MLRTPPRFTDPNLPPLDDADRRIVAALIADGRASGREVAASTGISEANVSRRLARILEERSVRIVGFVPPEFLGLQVQFVMYLRVRGDVDAAATELLRHPEFSYVTAAFGPCDIVTYGVVRSTKELVSLLDRSIYANAMFYRVDVHHVLEFIDPTRVNDAVFHAAPPRPVDRTDRLILRQLQEDGRMSFTDIAARTGISATSAADRFRKLASDGIVRILALPDPSRIGLQLSGLAGFSLRRPAREVVGRLAALPELAFFTMMTGEFPLRCEYQVRNGAHMDDLRERLLSVPGIEDVLLSVHRRLFRQDYVWGTEVPAD